jgi:hypothetical protein
VTAIAGPSVIRDAPAAEFTPKYLVTCHLALVKDSQGLTHHAYQGAVLEWLSPEQEKHLLGLGLIEKIDGK